MTGTTSKFFAEVMLFPDRTINDGEDRVRLA
jgi:hypothetical protein